MSDRESSASDDRESERSVSRDRSASREDSARSADGSQGGSHERSPKRSRSRSYSRSKSRSRSRSRSRRHQHRQHRSRSRSRRHRTRSGSRSHRRRYTRSRSRSYDRRRSSRYDRGDSYRSYRRSRSRSPFSSRRRHLGDRENPEQSKCLGVFGLSLYTQERDLRDVFERYGPVDEVQVVFDHQTGRSRGFAFIYMRNYEDAVEAKEMAAGTEIDGRKIRVDFSITKRAHTPTPGVYLGKPTTSYRNGPVRPEYRRGSRSYSRSYSRSPRR